jgi:hypothetical protein
MNRSGVLRPYLHQKHQKPMQKAPPLERPNPRASEAAIRSQTGGSGPSAPPGHHHIHYHRHGDHRQPGLHSGKANRSRPPEVTAGSALPPGAFAGNGNGGPNNGR